MKKLHVLSLLVLVMLVSLFTACSSEQAGSTGEEPQTGKTAGSTAITGNLTGDELYRQALEASVGLGETRPYVSFQMDSGSVKMDGEFKGDMEESGRMKGKMDVNGTSQGIPLSMSVEMIIIKEQDTDDTFMRFTSVSTSNPQYNSSLQAYFAPAINKWVKSDDKGGGGGNPKSFEEDGPIASIDALGIFFPITSLSDSDRQIFLSAVDKYGVYHAGDVQLTQYHGVSAKKITVTANKEALVAAEGELSGSLSPDAKFERSEQQFLDELFGSDGQLSADVYLDPDTGKIIGVELLIMLDTPVKESDFDTTIQRIRMTSFADYNRDLEVAAPESYMTEKEMDALMEKQS